MAVKIQAGRGFAGALRCRFAALARDPAKYPHASVSRLDFAHAAPPEWNFVQCNWDWFGIFAVAVMAFALMCPSAEAGPLKRRKEDPA